MFILGKLSVFVVLVIALNCCVYNVDEFKNNISDCDMFSSYIGKNVLLKKAVGVVKEKGVASYSMFEKSSKLYKELSLGSYDDIEIIQELGPDSKLTINRVIVRRVYAGPILIIAEGDLYINENGPPVKFEYIWADTYEIPRAPWDNNSVPEKRILLLSDKYTCN